MSRNLAPAIWLPCFMVPPIARTSEAEQLSVKKSVSRSIEMMHGRPSRTVSSIAMNQAGKRRSRIVTDGPILSLDGENGTMDVPRLPGGEDVSGS